MRHGSDIAAANRDVYAKASTARWYVAQEGLFPAEDAALAMTAASWQGKDVLDIGVGGGRTSPYIAPQARSYIGVDYSPAMILAAKSRYPDLDFRQGDARDLSQFSSASFDYVLFSYNGIDAVDDEGRTQVLAEAKRVLRPNGVFVFSSHNIDSGDNKYFWRDLFRFQLSRSPVATLRSFLRIPARIRNYLGAARSQASNERYAIKLDPGNDFASPHYYAGVAEISRQIQLAGLVLLAVLDLNGLETKLLVEQVSSTLHYITQKGS